MDPLTLAPFIGLFGGLAAAVYAALRFNREDAGQVVEQQSTALADALKLNEHYIRERDYIQERLTAVRKERDELEALLADEKTKSRQVEENLRVCILRQEQLEAQLRELGEDPGHAQF